MVNKIRLGNFEESLIDEISTLSGYSPLTVRDILESTFLRELEFCMQKEDIQIPFVGKVHVKYIGEEYINGARRAKIECFFSPSELLTKLLGDIEDGESDIINNFLQSKIKSALQDMLDKKE